MEKVKSKADGFTELQIFIAQLRQEANLISPERKLLLAKLGAYVAEGVQEDHPVKLHFICTHNSRRSQVGQVWATALAFYLGLDQVVAFSGGTEVTAFNPRAIAALERAGFRIDRPAGENENPHYRIHYSEKVPPLLCFSKTTDDPTNPQRNFAAIMTCSDADENCPFLPGADLRLPLTYEDPKAADDTPEETIRYAERVRQIGREILYALQSTEN